MRYVNTQFQKIPKYFDASEMCYFVSCSIRERMCILVAIFSVNWVPIEENLRMLGGQCNIRT